MNPVVQFDTLVGLGVGLHASGVEVVPNTSCVVVYPRTHRVVGLASVALLEADSSGVKVAPTLTHATRFEQVQAARVPWSTSETVRQSVCVLVDDNTSFKRAIPDGGTPVPNVHSHAGSLTVRRSGEVSIVEARSILGIQVNKIVTNTTRAVVVNLKVACSLVETQVVKEIVVFVRCVEQLGN